MTAKINKKNVTTEAVDLLKELIRLPSPSGDEDKTADLLLNFLKERGIPAERKCNNLMAVNRAFDERKPTILLNSHHDTVKPGKGWSADPYEPVITDGRLTGLGSNDAGGPLVSLLAAFLYFYERKDMKYNLLFLATAEEESTGPNGMTLMVPDISFADFAIVGEPTGMAMAVAEKGLIVLECTAHGKTGHAARDTGENALYHAVDDINWFRNHCFSRVSDVLGPVKMTVTMIDAGIQHNVIPDSCNYTVDIRSTDVYTHEEIMDTITANITSEITRSSLRLNPSSIDRGHPVVLAAGKMGIPTFGSPTLSDQALLPMPSIKMGPGLSERSHTPNEFIGLSEIHEGIAKYITLLSEIVI